MTADPSAETLREILSAYGLEGSRARRLESADNAVYRLDASDGARFTLRVHHGLEPADAIAAHVSAEFGWLEHVRATTDLIAPRPVALRSGEPCGRIATGDRERVYTLYEWIEGARATEAAAHREDPRLARRMGVAIGRLHESSRTFAAPRALCAVRWGPHAFFGPGSWIERGGARDDLGSEAHALLMRGGERIRSTVEGLGEDGRAYGLIHSDVHAGNMLVTRGGVAILDFCDCGWGHYLFDLGTMLNELMLEPESYPDRSAEFLEGYSSVSPLSPSDRVHLESFIALRAISSLCWIARSPDPDERRRALAEGSWVSRFLDQVRSYVREGVVRV